MRAQPKHRARAPPPFWSLFLPRSQGTHTGTLRTVTYGGLNTAGSGNSPQHPPGLKFPHLSDIRRQKSWTQTGFSPSARLTFGVRQFSVVGTPLCIVGCSAASLAWTHEMPGAAPSQLQQPKMCPDIARCSLEQATLWSWPVRADGEKAASTTHRALLGTAGG